MLKPDTLKQKIQEAVESTFQPALEQAFTEILPCQTQQGIDYAKQFAETITTTIAEPFAEQLSSAIDYYVKNAEIFGTIITIGTPITQTAIVQSTSVPVSNGAIPNTLGIR